jgi:hypothetical protein
MSIRRALCLAGFAAAAATAAPAEVRELSGAELRDSVASGQSRPLGPIVEMVGRQVEGEFVDARAYDADGIYYRILIRTPDGKLASVIVDARTGGFVSARSSVAQDIVATARSRSGGALFRPAGSASSAASSGNSRAEAATQGGSRGNSGNAGGNRGNSGGGNSGGGNSGGGNGGGNSGGNSGGGNSGGGNSGGGNGGGNSGGGNGNSGNNGNGAGKK